MTRLTMGARAMRIASFALGAALLAWLILSSGVGSLAADLARVGPGVLIILAIEFGTHALNTLGWRFTLPTNQRAGTFGWLFWVRSAGQAINESTPAASLGGEPTKIVLLRSRMSTGAAAASLLATKVSFCAAQAIFIVAGMAVVWPRLHLSHDLSVVLLVAFVAIMSGIGMFAIVQIRGIGPGTIRTLHRVRVPARWIAHLESSLHDVDAHLRDFYRARTGDLLRAMAAHAGALGFGAVQVLLLVGWMGLPFDPAAAFGIEAFASLVSLVTFVVPSSLGVQEGGKVLIFAALALPRSAAMAVGITFRLVAFADIAVGLAAFTLLQQRASPVSPISTRARTR